MQTNTPKPTFTMTEAQVEAVARLYGRNESGCSSLEEFQERLVRPMLFIKGVIEVSPWCGMVIGIEPDGYAHS